MYFKPVCPSSSSPQSETQRKYAFSCLSNNCQLNRLTSSRQETGNYSGNVSAQDNAVFLVSPSENTCIVCDFIQAKNTIDIGGYRSRSDLLIDDRGSYINGAAPVGRRAVVLLCTAALPSGNRSLKLLLELDNLKILFTYFG